MISFLPLLVVLIVLGEVNDYATTNLSFLNVDDHLKYTKRIGSTRHQVGRDFPSPKGLLVLFMEVPSTFNSAHDISSLVWTGEPTTYSVSTDGPAVARYGCALLTPMTASETTVVHEDRHPLTDSSDQLTQLYLASIRMSTTMVYYADILSQLSAKMVWPLIISPLNGGNALSEEICCSSYHSCTADNATVVEHYTSQTYNPGATGEKHLTSSVSATAFELKESPALPDIHNTDKRNASFSDTDNIVSIEEYQPVLMCSSDVESKRSHSLWHVLKCRNINTTAGRTNIGKKAKMMAQLESTMKQEQIAALTGGCDTYYCFICFTFVCLPLCVIAALVIHYSKLILSKLKETLFLNRVNLDNFNESNNSLSQLLMVTKSYIEVRDNELNEMQLLIKLLTAEKRLMQEKIADLLKDQLLLRNSNDMMKHERDEALKRELVYQDEVKRLDMYVEKLLLTVISNHPELLQHHQ